MAAAGQEIVTEDGESYIEKYTKGLSAVDTILHLDRLRQSVAVKERLKQKTLTPSQQQPVNMRKTMSVPNFVQMSQSFSLDNISQMSTMKSSISFHDGKDLNGR